METNQFASISDQELVRLLLAEDTDAWNYVLLQLVAPLCRARKYMEICRRFSFPSDSLVSAVWLLLRNNDYQRLRIFRFASSFKTYLYLIVREAQRNEIREYCGKIPLELSDDDNFFALIPDEKAPDEREQKEKQKKANKVLSQVWDDNPKQAWVLLMRNAVGLSAKEVATFLNESVDNVDQLNKRAKTKMKQLSQGE